MKGAQQQVCKVCSEILVSTCLTSTPKAMKIGPWLPGLEVGMDLGRDLWDPDMDLLQVAGTALARSMSHTSMTNQQETSKHG